MFFTLLTIATCCLAVYLFGRGLALHVESYTGEGDTAWDGARSLALSAGASTGNFVVVTTSGTYNYVRRFVRWYVNKFRG